MTVICLTTRIIALRTSKLQNYQESILEEFEDCFNFLEIKSLTFKIIL